jgi:uncharacterized protein involved in exopolysaccharide biosynthesis
MTEARTPDSGQIPLTVEVAVALARRWRVLVGVPAVVALVTLLVVLFMPNRYSAVTTFVPETRGQAGASGALASLAAATGLAIGGGDPGQSPQFYADLLKSAPIVYGVLETRFAGLARARTGAAGDSLALVDYFEPGSDPLDARLERGATSLRVLTGVSLDRATGVVKVTVSAGSAALAAAIAGAYVDQLKRFNRDARQTQARSRRAFAETRVREASQELEAAEAALRAFAERNRVATSPGLRFEEGRLERQVQIRQDVYMSLNRELEAARINEADESPALTVIETALVPTRKSGPNRRRTLLGVTFGALVLTMSWVVFFELQREKLRAGAVTLEERALPLLPGWVGRVGHAWRRRKSP